jgi:hypothetical protein
VRRRFLTSAWRHSTLPAKKIPEHRGYSTLPEGDADAADAADAAADAADSAADAADSASDSVADADFAADAADSASDSADAADSAGVGPEAAAVGRGAVAADSADRVPGGERCGLGVVMFGQRSARPLSCFAQICLARACPLRWRGREGVLPHES